MLPIDIIYPNVASSDERCHQQPWQELTTDILSIIKDSVQTNLHDSISFFYSIRRFIKFNWIAEVDRTKSKFGPATFGLNCHRPN